jgi:polar amino acid transport system substrate-binding protein
MPDEKSAVTPLGIAVLLALAAGVFAVAMLRSSGASLDPALLRIRRSGEVRIGIANEAPYGYLDTDTGRVTGEAPEIARAIFSRMGIEHIEVVSTEFGSLIPGLKAGRFDVIAAGMYITPERCSQIAFSDPTYRIGEAFLVERGNPADLHAFEDVRRDPGTKLGVVAGAVELGYARALGLGDRHLVIYNDNVSALEGVRAGQVDAFACTVLTAENLLRRTGDDAVERAEPFEQPVIEGREQVGYGAFGFRKEDRALRAAFNRELQEFLGSAEHLELVRPFGFTERTLPRGATADRLCRS